MSEEHKENHEKKIYKFSVDGKVFEYDKPTISGAEIKTIAHINPSDSLFMEVRGEEHDRQITDTTSVRLHEHEIEKFYTVPPTTFGSHGPI